MTPEKRARKFVKKSAPKLIGLRTKFAENEVVGDIEILIKEAQREAVEKTKVIISEAFGHDPIYYRDVLNFLKLLTPEKVLGEK